MIQETEIVLSPQQASSREGILSVAAAKLRVPVKDISDFHIIRKSLDARQRDVKILLKVMVSLGGKLEPPSFPLFEMRDVSKAPEVLIAGAGPAGLFAAAGLIRAGFKPVLVERGEEVSERKKSVAGMYRNSAINPESNYCFGEGGAGTFSDGKLYTRSSKRGDVKEVLGVLHQFGAPDEILVDAHPHIGSDKLPGIIRKFREALKECGAVFHFNTRIDDLVIGPGGVEGVRTSGGLTIRGKCLVAATGHSSGDFYRLLDGQRVFLEPKPFALGFRIEHPQELIDTIFYHGAKRGGLLPPATYSLLTHMENRSVFSFCMCPGGFIVPAGTLEGEKVVNGMSASARNTPFANSGFVAEVGLADFASFTKEKGLAGLAFRDAIEASFGEGLPGGIVMPAQRIGDFIRRKRSASLPETSYSPGLTSAPLHEKFPSGIADALAKSLVSFGNRHKGFVSENAVAAGAETRTSAPVRITRHPETLESVSHPGLFPCGEGAGYAGGIVSAALDGLRIATAIKQKFS